MVGHEVGAFYLPEYVTVMNGEFIYKSVAGGYTNDLTQAKRKFVGTPSPDVTLGWNNSFKFFQNFTLDISIRSMIGNDVYNATKMFFDAPGNLTSLNGVSDALDWVPKGGTTATSQACWQTAQDRHPGARPQPVGNGSSAINSQPRSLGRGTKVP